MLEAQITAGLIAVLAPNNCQPVGVKSRRSRRHADTCQHHAPPHPILVAIISFINKRRHHHHHDLHFPDSQLEWMHICIHVCATMKSSESSILPFLPKIHNRPNLWK
ncbi:hypothetical protein ACTXT7_006405 [Hymenolepis weldensis]